MAAAAVLVLLILVVFLLLRLHRKQMEEARQSLAWFKSQLEDRAAEDQRRTQMGTIRA